MRITPIYLTERRSFSAPWRSATSRHGSTAAGSYACTAATSSIWTAWSGSSAPATTASSNWRPWTATRFRSAAAGSAACARASLRVRARPSVRSATLPHFVQDARISCARKSSREPAVVGAAPQAHTGRHFQRTIEPRHRAIRARGGGDWRSAVIPGSFAYHRPGSVNDAVALLADLGEDARPLAGGHSLIPMMKLRLATPEHLVDLAAIADLKGIRIDGGEAVIGAMTTQHELIASADL